MGVGDAALWKCGVLSLPVWTFSDGKKMKMVQMPLMYLGDAFGLLLYESGLELCILNATMFEIKGPTEPLSAWNAN